MLVVEDEPSFRAILTEMLRGLGCTVTAVKNGRAAVDYYATAHQQVDLVVLDMVMPVMNGKAAFIALRRVNPNVRVLLSSGHSLDGDVQATLDEGAVGFIQKPYRRAALARKLSEILGTAHH